MRKAAALLLTLLFAAPAVAAELPHSSTADGALSVVDGRGEITLGVRSGMVGGVIGRIDKGCVAITDMSPEDLSFPLVWGDDEPQVDLPRGGVKWCGAGVRFRLIGGKFRAVVTGRGIDLSAVGVGEGTIVTNDVFRPGVYSLDGDDCRSPRTVCKPLPIELTRFKLGTTPPERAEKPERGLSRNGSA